MLALPSLDLIVRRCRELAALDLILSPVWQYRYYSFNAHWSDHEMMASMRDGSGDEWWGVFHDAGWAALKGLGHDSDAWSKHGEALGTALQKAIPKEMASFSQEPAFAWDSTSFAYFLPKDAAAWTRANDLTPFRENTATGESELLAHVIGSPADYARFAADVFEVEVSQQLVASIFALRPISTTMVMQLNPEASLEEIADELYEEIGYPRK